MNLFYQKDDCLQNVILALEWANFWYIPKLSYVLKNEDKIILNYTKKAESTTVESFDEL